MLTQCPECETIYRLGAGDLSAAQGFVECGECGCQFYALERLADEPKFVSPAASDGADDAADDAAPAPRPAPPITLLEEDRRTAAPPSEPRSDPSTDMAAPVGPDAPAMSFDDLVSSPAPAAAESAEPEPAAPALADQSADPEPSTDAAGRATDDTPAPSADDAAPVDFRSRRGPAGATLSEAEHAILFTEPETSDDGGLDEPGDEPDDLDLDDVPAILKEEVAALRRTRARGRWPWVVAALVLCVALVLQAGWLLRETLTSAWPSIRPWYAAVCARVGCEWRPPANAAAIELVARDVRDHPQYRDALLVNATLVNRTDVPVPYPVIQLALQGPAGNAVGVRRFSAAEYLDKSIDIDAGMPPNRPVYIVMEVAQPGNGAVSFEFRFL